MFNDYIWQTHLHTGGREIVEKFKSNLADYFSEEYADFITDLHKCYCLSIAINSGISIKVHVHCVIVGFSIADNKARLKNCFLIIEQYMSIYYNLHF